MPSQKKLDLPRGVTIRRHKNSTTIQIAFTYRGIECREPLKSIQVTKANIRYAERLLGEIKRKIELDQFRYPDYFPDSKRAVLFGYASSNLTIADLSKNFLAEAEAIYERSTYLGYRKIIKGHIESEFGNLRARDLTPGQIRQWVIKLQRTPKTIRNILIPLRLILDQAVTDQILPSNPLYFVNLKKLLKKNLAATMLSTLSQQLK